MNEKGNGKDKALARRQTLQQLSRLPAKRKLDALVDAPDARELIRAMPAVELYYALAEVGLAEFTEVVQLASPEQFRAFVDLGGWKRDRLDPHEVLTWLRAARGEEPEPFAKKLDALDPEVFSLLLRSFVTVHDLEEDPDVNPPGVTMETPEGKHLVEFHVEGVELSAMRTLLNDLFAQNPLEAVRKLEATRWEVPSELEEHAFRFRSGRVEDLGFPPLERAVSLFGWLDPDKVPPLSAPRTAGPAEAALARTADGASFLDHALRGLEPAEREGLEQELRALGNAALVAEIQDPGDLDAVRRVGELVRDYLSLGLEHLCAGDPALAAEAVREHDSRRIFQVGFSLTLRLKFRVDRLAKEPLALLGGSWLVLPEEAQVLLALRRKRPLRALKVEGAEPVPFRSRRELDEAARAVERAEGQVALFRALLGGTEEAARAQLAAFAPPLELLGTQKLLAGAVATVVLTGQARAAPVPAGRGLEVCDRLFEGELDRPRLRPAAEQAALDALTGPLPPGHQAAAREAVNRTLAHLLDELGAACLSRGIDEPTLGEVLPLQPASAL